MDLPGGAELDAHILGPDYSSFAMPPVNMRVTRGSLKAIRDSQLVDMTIEQLMQRQEELRLFFKEGAQILINHNIMEAVNSYKAVKALKPTEIGQMEWYKNIREELVRNEIEKMAQLERNYQIQMQSLDIMRDGQVYKLNEATTVSGVITTSRPYLHPLMRISADKDV
jgi:hypothetical protein